MSSNVSPPESVPAPKYLGSNLIAIMNEVHDALALLEIKSQIDLPQIAVVGSQSSGKSSVLEAIVGRDFLPRGSGIVTRCPLVLKLSQVKSGTTEWGEFGHKPGVKIDDFVRIRQEIEARTAQLAAGRTVSTTPISLTIFSPHVLDLTLIDLPGLVSNAVGDQPQDIDVQIKNMVLDFIRPPNTIILAISPANADLANSVALRAARSVDPLFDRTVGVLTKLDLMDAGTNALEILEGRLFPLKRGWIGVVNRSQKAINENISMMDAKRAEKEFFLNHPEYRHLAGRMGTDYLAQSMSSVLLNHIQKCLPDLRARIDELANKTRAKQEALGMLDEAQDKGTKILQLLHAYSRDIAHSIHGQASERRSETATSQELQGGARLHFILYEAFGRHIRSLQALPQLTTERLRSVIRNSSGLEASLFPSNVAFIKLTQEQILRLEEPTLLCVQFVYEELRKISIAAASRLDRFPTLRERVLSLTHQQLDALRAPCISHLKTWVAAERDHINVRNPAVCDVVRNALQILTSGSQIQQLQQGGTRPSSASAPSARAQASGPAQVASTLAMQVAAIPPSPPPPTGRFELPQRIVMEGDLTEEESREHAAIVSVVEGYFSVCKNTICDQAPKIISHLLIIKIEESINAHLMKALFKEQLFDELLAEDPQIASLRKATMRMMVCLSKAQEALDKVRDMPLSA